MSSPEVYLFAGSTSKRIIKEVAKYLNISVGDVYSDRWPGSREFICQFEQNIRKKDVYIVQSIEMPADESLMELLIMIDAARRSSAYSVTAIIPFFGYGRHDKKIKSRVPITARLVANMIQAAGADKVMTVDLHSAQIQGFFDIPVDHLQSSIEVISCIERDMNGIVDFDVVSPDLGGNYRASDYSSYFKTNMLLITKNRADNGRSIIGNFEPGRNMLLVDDIVETGETLIGAVELLKENGAGEISCIISHANIAKGRQKEIINNKDIKKIYFTNSISSARSLEKRFPTRCQVISLSRLIGEAIIRTSSGVTISNLFLGNKVFNRDNQK